MTSPHVDGAFKSQVYLFISISTGRVPTAATAATTCIDQRLIIIWNLTHPPFYSSAKAYRQQIALPSSWLDPSYEFYQEVSCPAAFTKRERTPSYGVVTILGIKCMQTRIKEARGLREMTNNYLPTSVNLRSSLGDAHLISHRIPYHQLSHDTYPLPSLTP